MVKDCSDVLYGFLSSTSGIPAYSSVMLEDMIDPILQRLTIQESSAPPIIQLSNSNSQPWELPLPATWQIFRTQMESHGVYLVYTLHRQIHRFFENIGDDDGQHVGF